MMLAFSLNSLKDLEFKETYQINDLLTKKVDPLNFSKATNNDLLKALGGWHSILQTQLTQVEFKRFSKTKDIINFVDKSLRRLEPQLKSNLYKDHKKAQSDVIKENFNVTKNAKRVISKTYDKTKIWLKKEGNSCKNGNVAPRIFKSGNDKILENTLELLLKFACKCVEKQEMAVECIENALRKVAMDKTEKGKENSKKEANVPALIKAFDQKDVVVFANLFPKNETVKAYMKKFRSETGKMLKYICAAAERFKTAYEPLDLKIKIILNGNYNDDIKDLILPEIKENIPKLKGVLRSCKSLFDNLDIVLKHNVKSKTLISLYDSRVKQEVKNMADKIDIYYKNCQTIEKLMEDREKELRKNSESLKSADNKSASDKLADTKPTIKLGGYIPLRGNRSIKSR